MDSLVVATNINLCSKFEQRGKNGRDIKETN